MRSANAIDELMNEIQTKVIDIANKIKNNDLMSQSLKTILYQKWLIKVAIKL